jgi:DNA (cytosine-5)-methyltransferase 1
MIFPDDPAEALKAARKFFTQTELAAYLGKSEKTIRRWENALNGVPVLIVPAIRELVARKPLQSHLPPDSLFTFIDLFAGIGGLRAGFESVGGECVYTSEWDSYAVKTYLANHRNGHPIDGDITTVDKAAIPDHDVLLAGFPCQPFSLAGVSKKNSLGRQHGFKDKAQGTLFFDVLEILRLKQPPVFVLENVKNLQSHDQGRTFEIITGALREIGYTIEYSVIDARSWVPQHRERIFIVGFREPTLLFDWKSIKKPDRTPVLRDILHSDDEIPEHPYTIRERNKTVVNPKYTLTDHLWNYLQAYAAKHRAAGNGFGYSVFGPEDVSRTLSARYHKDGSEILIEQKGKNPRRLTPRECARLMGFDRRNPKTGEWETAWSMDLSAVKGPMKIPVSDTRAYRQFGNAVVVPVVAAIAELVVSAHGIRPRPASLSVA